MEPTLASLKPRRAEGGLVGIPVEVPGLDAVMPQVPAGTVLVLDGGFAPAKGHLARLVALSAARAGRKVALVSTRAEEGLGPASGVELREAERLPESGLAGRDLVVDSFSLACLGDGTAAVAARMRGLRASAVQHGTCAILVLDEEAMDPGARAACLHLADTVLQFGGREEPDGPVQFLRVAKAPGNRGLGRNIFYTLDGPHLLIDTRRRVN